MAYGDLRDAVINNLGGRNNTTTIAIILARTNFFIEWLASQKEWEDLQNTVTCAFIKSQYLYTLTSLALTSADKIYSIYMNDGTRYLPPMTPVTKHVWNRDYQPSTASAEGKPSVWCKFGGNLLFSRTPDSTYAFYVDVYSQPTKIVTEYDSLPFANMQGLFEAMVTALTWLSLGEKELFDKWFRLAAPMCSQFNIDSSRMLNAASPPRSGESKSGDYWADPFRRK